MALFDYYQPATVTRCPACNRALEEEWQGYDGPCLMFVWRQGIAAPIDQRIDPDIRRGYEEMPSLRLPPTFVIRTHCCCGPFDVEAECQCLDGKWSEMTLITAQNARQRKEERRADFKARLRWLEGKGNVRRD